MELALCRRAGGRAAVREVREVRDSDTLVAHPDSGSVKQ
jgi:hypothetical protein